MRQSVSGRSRPLDVGEPLHAGWGGMGMQLRGAIAVDQLGDRASLTSCIRRGALRQPNVE